MKVHNTEKAPQSASQVPSGTGESKPAIFQLRGLQEMADNSEGVKQGKEVQLLADRAVQLSKNRDTQFGKSHAVQLTKDSSVQLSKSHAVQLKGGNTAPIQRVSIEELNELIIDNCPRNQLLDVFRFLMNTFGGQLGNVTEEDILKGIATFLEYSESLKSVERNKAHKRKQEDVDPPLDLSQEKKNVKKTRKEGEETEDGLGMEEVEEPAFIFSDNKEDDGLLKRKEVWLDKATKLKEHYKKQLADISTEKIAVVLLIYKQGIFSGMGEGVNTDYIRSKDNLVLLLRGHSFSAEQNAAGRLPDMYYDITPNEFIAIVDVLKQEAAKDIKKDGEEDGKGFNKDEEEEAIKDVNKDAEEGADVLKISETRKDEYILQQRYISQLIITFLGKESYEYADDDITDPLKVMVCIFDGNYPAVNIHFPALYAYISKIKNKPNVGELTYAAMSKFIMARLISAYNAESGEKPFLTEKSSFGFKMPTVDDLGKNLSIRLSPGIYETTVPPLVKALRRVEIELYEMMTSKERLRIPTEGQAPSLELGKYWGGKKDERTQNLNAKKTVLDHLLFTLIEKGPKVISIIGRVFERDPKNILALTGVNAPLEEIGKQILALHSLANLEASLYSGGITGIMMGAPQMLPNEVVNKLTTNEQPDHEAKRRLALMSAIADNFSRKKSGNDVWDEDASDSEFEDDDEEGRVSGNKIVVPSGMSTLNDLLGKEKKARGGRKKGSGVDPEIMEGSMAPDNYFEFSKHAKKPFNVTGYLANDAYVVDLNPNREKPVKKGENKIDTTEVNEQVAEIVGDLIKRNKKVWVVDITSSITAEQNFVYRQWRADGNAELIIFISSGLKNEQEGLNMNTYGTIHWAYKHPAEKDKIEALKKYFDSKKKLNIAQSRSAIGNQLRRHFKKQGGVMWDRIRGKGTGINMDRDKGKEKDRDNAPVFKPSTLFAPLPYTITHTIAGDGNCLYNSLRTSGMTGLSVDELRKQAALKAMLHYYNNPIVKPVRWSGETDLNYQERLSQYRKNLLWQRRTSNRVLNTLLNDQAWFDEGDIAAEFVLQVVAEHAIGRILLLDRGVLFEYNNGLIPVGDPDTVNGASIIVRGFNHYNVGRWGNGN